jgi:predicted alpha/beta-hydrolase family hydrolase
MTVTALRVAVDADHQVSALLLAPPAAVACYVMAHGAGAGMTHPFMAAAAEALARRGVATLRFQFPGMELGARRPDRPALAQATVRAAVAAAQAALPGLPLFAGGKSFGGRMTSQAQAEAPLAGARGLVFLGFPLHPAGKPSIERAAHLEAVRVPMLFVQGTRDALAEIGLLQPLAGRLGTLHAIEHGDHAFHVPARSGRTDASVMQEVLDTVALWMRDATGGGSC